MLLEDAKKNMNVRGLSEKQVTTDEELQTILQNGMMERKTEENGVNATSSRSHAVLQLMLRQGKKQVSKMAFIDLAGSEKGSDVAEMSKQTKIDGAEINKSLLALKECIRALEKDND
jgi:kinesin family protein 2/24